MVGYVESEVHQLNQRSEEALRLPEWEVKDDTERQRSHDFDIRIRSLTSGFPAGLGVLGRDCVFIESHRYGALSAQARLVVAAVSNEVLCLELPVDKALLARGHGA